MNQELDKFLQRYGAQLRTSPLKYYRKTSVPATYDYNSTSITNIDIQAEPGVELTMSERDFSFLLEMHDKLEELIYRPPDRYRGRGVEYLLAQTEKETRLRNHYPQLKELYDQYQTLLRLLDDGRD